MFEMDKTYNFSSKSNTILNGEYKNMKVVSLMSYKQASRFCGNAFSDVSTIRQQLMAELGVSLLNVTEVNYVLFEDSNGEEVLLGKDWILEDTISLVSAITGNIIVPNITSDDLITITDMIKAIGYTNITYNAV